MQKMINDLIKNNKVIPITNDIVFKNIFEDEEMRGILSFLIYSVTDLSLEESYGNIVIENSYIPNNNAYLKQNTADLKVRIDNNTITLEMNSTKSMDTQFRNMTHYHASIVQKLIKSSNIENIGKVFQISFDNKNYISDDIVSTLMVMDVKNHVIDPAEAGFKKYRVNLSKVRKKLYNKNVKEINRFERILYMMSEDNVDELRKYAMDDKELNKMVDKLEKLREDPEFISIISEDHINKLATQSAINKAKESGLKKGEESGIKKGEELEKKRAAKKMLAEKLDISLISKITDFTEEEIKSLEK